MTDNEIIKALECCNDPQGRKCKECYYSDDPFCLSSLTKAAFYLVNRQNAEIERLRVPDLMIEHLSMSPDELLEKIRNIPVHIISCKNEAIKAEAIKEFAKRLKERFLNLEYQANTTRKTLPIAFVKDQTDWMLHEVSIETIDNLVKEMVGASDV